MNTSYDVCLSPHQKNFLCPIKRPTGCGMKTRPGPNVKSEPPKASSVCK